MAEEVKQPVHCEHECICTKHIGSVAWKDSTPCMANHKGCKECIHDTRSHPAAQPINATTLLDIQTMAEGIVCAVQKARQEQQQAPDALKVLEDSCNATIRCNSRWGNKLEPYYIGINTHAKEILNQIATIRSKQGGRE